MTKLILRVTVSILAMALVALLSPLAAQAQQSPTSKPANKLVTAKLICVTPMPDDVDQWILEDLRVWGKYKVTGDQEGADLVMRAFKPEKQPRYVLRQGVPQTKKERAEPPAVLITVIDWVANEAVWQADILDKKPKKQAAEEAPGPEVDIYARGLKPAELAQKLTRKLRDYVDQLEKSSGANKP